MIYKTMKQCTICNYVITTSAFILPKKQNFEKINEMNGLVLLKREDLELSQLTRQQQGCVL